METEKELKKLRKKPIIEYPDIKTPLNYSRNEIEKIIPHRKSMLLIDRITGIDLSESIVTGERFMDPKDPVFEGHFPDFPVYPGTLQIEMIGQMGLCLYYFITNNTTTISGNPSPPEIRATKVLGAHYLYPVRPGDNVILIAQKLSYDGIFAQVIGQTIVNDKICSVAVGEVYFPE